MPIDGHAYLVKQGWGGKGTGLRHGAIARPVTITQKKTLSGVGKDRDEAFPFWDHVFEAAAMSIQVKVSKDSDDEDSDSDTAPTPTLDLQRTKTGMISHRRHHTGTPALSGTATPDVQAGSSSSGSVTPRLSLMAAAKQEAAKRMLYANFFRGPVLGPTDPSEMSSAEGSPITSETTMAPEAGASAGDTKKMKKGKVRARGSSLEDPDDAPEKTKKMRSQVEAADEDEARKEKRRRKRKEAEEGERKQKKRRKREAEHTPTDEAAEKTERKVDAADNVTAIDGAGEDKRAAKAEKKRRKEEKRAAKEARRKRKLKDAEVEGVDDNGDLIGDGGVDRHNRPSSDSAHTPDDAPSKRKKRDKVSTGDDGEGRVKKKRHRSRSSSR